METDKATREKRSSNTWLAVGLLLLAAFVGLKLYGDKLANDSANRVRDNSSIVDRYNAGVNP